MSTIDATANPAGTYIPGYARQKAIMILLGLLIFVLGVWQIHTPLRLLVFGQRSTAEATYVIKTKAGLPDLILRDDPQIQSHLEPRDHSYVFWNEFSFHTTDDRVVNVRATVGGQLKPLYPLIDADGLPTTDLIWYDPGNPETVVFPLLISTWFAPGMLIFAGLLATLIGSVLLYWANRPIALPHIPSSAGLAAEPPGEPPPPE